MKTAQSKSDNGLYAHREQLLLDALREAQMASVLGEVSRVLEMQAQLYGILAEIIGLQTQTVLKGAGFRGLKSNGTKTYAKL